MTVLWPVFVDREPLTPAWAVGDRVSPTLRWCDSPGLPEDLVLHDVALLATRYQEAGGQLLSRGALTAARTGHDETGEITLSGVLYYDRMFHVPATSGTVRRIRVVTDLHDRGPDRWVRRPGATRTTDVPDTAPERLTDDPELPGLTPSGSSWTPPPGSSWTPPPGSLRFLSEQQYLRAHGHLLPERQWRARGFLIRLELA